MKRAFYCFIGWMALGAVTSCGPSAYTMEVELRHPSASGFDLVGKNLGVVFLDNGDSGDSTFIATLSGSFADKLDREYFHGDSLVTLYRLEKKPGVNYEHRDTMINLLVEAGVDVLFLFDEPDFKDITIPKPVTDLSGNRVLSGVLPYTVTLYTYDSMNSDDQVVAFHGTRNAVSSVYLLEDVPENEWPKILKDNMVTEAEEMGGISGEKFMMTWKKDRFYFYIYDSSKWYDSYYAVSDYRWQDAMDIWMSMLDTKNLQKKACLEHNIATACYILGQFELADEWIKLSAKDYELPLTEQTASLISSRL